MSAYEVWIAAPVVFTFACLVCALWMLIVEVWSDDQDT